MRFVTKPHTFIKRNLALIKTCDEILSNRNSGRYNISLRKLFYRLVIQSTLDSLSQELLIAAVYDAVETFTAPDACSEPDIIQEAGREQLRALC